MHVVYAGSRVRLRPFTSAEEFADLLEELSLQVHEFWAYSWWPRQEMLKEFEKHGMLASEPHFSFFAIERLDTGELIGFEVAQVPAPHQIRASIGTVILERHWHQGFGREAKELAMCFVFENFPVVRVDAGTLSTHTRAMAGLAAVGMHLEGERGSAFTMGRYRPAVSYAIRREEWEQLPMRKSVRRGGPKSANWRQQ